MSDEQPTHSVTRTTDSDRVLAVVNYVLFLVSPGTIGLTTIVAVILAYVRRDRSDGFVTSHYTYQIYTFWYALGIAILGWLTVWILGLGLLIWLLGALWVVVRSVIGLMRLVDGRPNPDPTQFWF